MEKCKQCEETQKFFEGEGKTKDVAFRKAQRLHQDGKHNPPKPEEKKAEAFKVGK